MDEPRYALYEIVRLRDTAGNRSKGVAGQEGAVLGISRPEEGAAEPGYAVWLDEVGRCCWFEQRDVERTGRATRHEDFYDGTSIRVSSRGEVLD